jgi:hypothetical protein
MFNANDLLNLLKARPFVPFRLVLTEGGMVEVKRPKFVMPGHQFALFAIPDPTAPETLIEWYTTVWYTLVIRVELIEPADTDEAPTPAPNVVISAADSR